MLRRVVAAAALAAALAVPSAASARPAIDAGSLRVRLAADPSRLVLAEPGAGVVLAEHPGTGSGPDGTLGFRTAAGWEHATRVAATRRDGDDFVAELETTDPSRGIELRLTREREGVIGLVARILGPTAGVDAVGAAFDGSPGERYLGFGERSDAASRTGGEVESYVADGPYQPEEYAVLPAFVPLPGLRPGRADATYYPLPWLLSTAGYGVLVGNPETSTFSLGDGGAWRVAVTAAPAGQLGAGPASAPSELRLRFFAGPDPADALRRFTATTGRQPAPAAPWLFGAWYQADGEAAAELEQLRRADAPVSVLQTYTHYLPCGAQAGREQQEQARVAAAHEAGVAITTYFNPMVCTSYSRAYAPAAAAGALTADSLGNPYVYRYGADVDDLFFVSQFDFFTEAGRETYSELLAEAVGHGYDGWMEDFGEYTPLDSVSGPPGARLGGARAHNPYAAAYHCAAWDAVRALPSPVIRFQRSGWTGATGCAQVVWGGDPTTDWGFDGLRSAVRQAISAGSSGIAFWGSDIGGFFALGARELTPELLTRWVQVGAASPVMRTQANGVAVPARSRPQVIDPDQLPNWRRWAKFHTQLYPYLAAAAAEYASNGMPLVRDLALAYPRVAAAAGHDDEYLLGADLLVAPVLDPGTRERAVYLPPGRWIDLWRSARYRERRGDLRLRRAALHPGNETIMVPAPLGELPIFVRAGAVIPLLDPAVDSLARYGDAAAGVVGLGERRRRMQLLAFPRGRSVSRFLDGERLVSAERRGAWRLTIAGKRRRSYALQVSLATLRRPFAPCEVSAAGHDLAPSRWRYDRASRVLRVRVRGRRVVVEVRRCGSDRRAHRFRDPEGATRARASARPR